MCGRFLRTSTVEDIVEAFSAEKSSETIRPSYNVSPSQRLIAVRGGKGSRQIFFPKWGFDAHWKSDRSSLVINARVEGLTERRMFRSLIAEQRCVIPISGYYEWVSVAETIARLGSPKKKIPFLVSTYEALTDPGRPIAAAGLWQETADDARVVMLTTSAADSVAFVHDRMPVLLEGDLHAEWLSSSSVVQLDEVARPYGGVLMTRRVGYEVNDARNDFPTLVGPYAGDAQGSLF